MLLWLIILCGRKYVKDRKEKKKKKLIASCALLSEYSRFEWPINRYYLSITAQ